MAEMVAGVLQVIKNDRSLTSFSSASSPQCLAPSEAERVTALGAPGQFSLPLPSR